jgi:hypothetical protein
MWPWRRKQVLHITRKGEAMIRLKTILRQDGCSPSEAYAIAIRVCDDFNEWPLEKKIEFTKEIEADEKELRCSKR